MTNAGTPGGGGGMPKWLIILLVVVLVMILGCCGGVTTCWFLARRAARAGMPAFQQWAQDTQKRLQDAQAQAQAQAAAAQAQAAAAQARAANGGATPVVTPGADAGTAATPGAATPAAGGGMAAGVVGGQKMPANFPSDVPVEDGMTTALSAADLAKGGGMVMLKGNIKTDDVVDYYTKAMAKAGYTQSSNTAVNGMTQTVYTKDAQQILVQVMPGDGGGATSSNVVITYGKK